MVQFGRKSNSSKILCMFSLPASIKRTGSKTTKKRWRHRFPYYKSMGAFCCHRNQSCKPICPKTICNLSPTLMMLHIKIDQHWPTGLREAAHFQMLTFSWSSYFSDNLHSLLVFDLFEYLFNLTLQITRLPSSVDSLLMNLSCFLSITLQDKKI